MDHHDKAAKIEGYDALLVVASSLKAVGKSAPYHDALHHLIKVGLKTYLNILLIIVCVGGLYRFFGCYICCIRTCTKQNCGFLCLFFSQRRHLVGELSCLLLVP